ncbi:hypothetical protein GCG21_15845 [Pseudactinotalea sp. HY160]|uniref:FAD/NAD(P)-binding protein n=1 Tax=Pseudactinotalea sp. HY160 TaxID=2654490 RepID=UPI00128C484F|nr:FAD/NAD(P)-binding protein [Pseudactinotalea sp. HY160]MPV51453.1 hypothetical protein [Pseudactinotalea sp. HY160]
MSDFGDLDDADDLDDLGDADDALAGTAALADLVADVVVVGGGPRAISLLERLTARLGRAGGGEDGGSPALRAVLIDAVEVGAGATWRTDQSAEFLNNTYAAHTTIYPDSSTRLTGPLTPGPDLIDWARAIAARPGASTGCSPRSASPVGTTDARLGGIVGGPWPVASARPAWAVAEAATLEPWSYPTRRLQGVYYREQLEAIVARGGVEVTELCGLVVGIDPVGDGGTAASPARCASGVAGATGVVGVVGAAGIIGAADTRTVRLADGRSVTAPAVVLAQGMVQGRPDARVLAFREAAAVHGLTYIEPGMPAERDWAAVPGGEDVLVAGLGANFFDVVTTLTAGRGGRFEQAGASAFDLRYVPSGREPRLVVGSRRGLPYRSKSFYGGFPPPYRPQLATAEWFAEAAQVPDQEFGRDVWPQLAREFVVAHLATLAAHHPAAVPTIAGPGASGLPGVPGDWDDAATVPLPASVLARIEQTDVADLEGLVDELVAQERWRIDPTRLDRPDLRGPDPARWAKWVERWREAELDSIADPLRSPRCTVNRAMAFLRGRVARLVRGGAIDAASALREVNGWFAPLGLALASGPPPERTAQLLALVRAGVVELLGEGSEFTTDGEEFVGRSIVRGREFHARALVETRMSKGHVDVTDDPLLRSLLTGGRARLLRRSTGPGGQAVTARTLDVTTEEFALVDAGGRADRRVFVLGIPAGDVQPGSAIGATPGVPSPLIAGADLVAGQVIEIVRAEEPAAVIAG